MSKELEAYYNKFCEEKRLTRRHGNVEFVTSMKYIAKGRQNFGRGGWYRAIFCRFGPRRL